MSLRHAKGSECDEMATKGDQTAVFLHCANCRGPFEATCHNGWEITPDLAQSITGVIGTVLNDMDIYEVWMHITNVFHKSSECWKRILHTHVVHDLEPSVCRAETVSAIEFVVHPQVKDRR